MDDNRFDRWTRGLGRVLTRRNLGGLTAGSLLAMQGVALTEAKKKNKKSKKKKSCPSHGRACRQAVSEACADIFPDIYSTCYDYFSPCCRAATQCKDQQALNCIRLKASSE